jgi:hypothetical protein
MVGLNTRSAQHVDQLWKPSPRRLFNDQSISIACRLWRAKTTQAVNGERVSSQPKKMIANTIAQAGIGLSSRPDYRGLHPRPSTHGCDTATRAGHAPEVRSGDAGHSTITLTLDTYSHVIPGLHAQAAAEMQKLFTEDAEEVER